MTFAATHQAPAAGLGTWDQPDATRPAGPALTPHLPVRLVQVWGDWAHVECSNGWRAWVDGRHLLPLPAAAAVAPAPAAPAPAAPAPVAPVATAPATVATSAAPGAALDQSPVKVGGLTISAPLVGAVLVVVGTFLPWISNAGVSSNAMDLPVKFLVDFKVATYSGLKIGILMLALGVGALGLSVKPVSRTGRRALGLAIVVVATVFTAQLQRLVGLTRGQTESAGLFKLLGFGVYVTLAGGLAVALGKVPGEPPRR